MNVYIVFLNDYVKGVFKERVSAEKLMAVLDAPEEGCFARVEKHDVTIG